jgi:ankyrin repeat protein
VRTGAFSLDDARLTIARTEHFADWQQLRDYAAEVSRKYSPIWQFESAVDAIVTGDLATLSVRLRDNSELIAMRSMRDHQATLLHYVGANGVESYRQQSPANAAAIAELLLNMGAKVDALADMYGKATTLCLVSTSIHPRLANVQIPLIETLLAHGAAVDGAPDRWPPIMAALANGHPEAARTLAQLGARVCTIVAAAGIGRLDLVRNFVNQDGSLRPLQSDVPLWGVPHNPAAQVEKAFLYACQYGFIDVADFLLQHGVQIDAQDNAGQTGLHHAIIGGQLNLTQWLLQRYAPLDVRNMYGGTPLGQALWCVVNGNSTVDYVSIIEILLKAGAQIESGTIPWLANQTTLSPTTKTQLTAVFQRFSTAL